MLESIYLPESVIASIATSRSNLSCGSMNSTSWIGIPKNSLSNLSNEAIFPFRELNFHNPVITQNLTMERYPRKWGIRKGKMISLSFGRGNSKERNIYLLQEIEE